MTCLVGGLAATGLPIAGTPWDDPGGRECGDCGMGLSRLCFVSFFGRPRFLWDGLSSSS